MLRTSIALMFCLFISMMGCGEYDELGIPLQSTSFTLQSEYFVMDSDSATSSEALLSELAGQWDGLGDSTGTRFVIQPDGYYSFWKQRRDGTWFQDYDGHFWIEFHQGAGLYRTEIHMDIPDLDDYSVRYHIIDDILYFEEPTDTEQAARYQRIK